MTTDRPIWPMSCYGPGTDAPRQLIEGDVEQSPEEMRVRAYLMVAQGEQQQIVRTRNTLTYMIY
jgi:nucleoporin NUP42